MVTAAAFGRLPPSITAKPQTTLAEIRRVLVSRHVSVADLPEPEPEPEELAGNREFEPNGEQRGHTSKMTSEDFVFVAAAGKG